MKMVLLGPPGAGKGTQAEILARKLDIPTISTGDILRESARRGTTIGLKAKEFIDYGELVPNEVIVGIVIDRVSKQDCKGGYILDGMPRTIAQAEALREQGIETDVALVIEIPDSVIRERLRGRRVCPNCNATYHIEAKPPVKNGVCNLCGAGLTIRSDDEPQKIENRLIAYHRESEPLKEYYKARNKLKAVENIHGIEETAAAIWKVLGLDND